MADFFLSAAGRDREVAERLRTALLERGFSVWRDADLAPGMDYKSAVEREIHAATSIVVLWTPASVNSIFVLQEADRGRAEGKLISVKSDDLRLDAIPVLFRDYRVYSVSEFIDSLDQVQASQTRLDAEYRQRMDKDNAPPTIDPEAQAERDAIYAGSMEQDDVPPSVGSAPISSPAPELPKPGPALTEKILPAAATSDGPGWAGGAAAPYSPRRVEGVGAASTSVAGLDDFLQRWPAAAKAPARAPTGNVALTRAKIEEFALLRQHALAMAGAVAPVSQHHDSGGAFEDRRKQQAIQERALRQIEESQRETEDALRREMETARRREWEQRESEVEVRGLQSARRGKVEHHHARESAGSGGWFYFVLIAALVSLPFWSQTVREGLASVLAGLGLKLNAFNLFGMFGKGAAKSTPPESSTKVDDVDCSVYSPPSAPMGATVLIQVFLHVPQQAARVHGLATMMDRSTALKGVQTLSASIARGAKVDVYLSAPGLGVEEPAQSFIWRGEPVFCQFLATLPHAAVNTPFYPIVRLSVGGGLVGRIVFGVEAIHAQEAGEAALNATQSAPAGHSAQRYRKAFLSYATPDRREVLKRAQALEAAGVSFFQDILSLEPGARWQQELYKHIDDCDLFLLFWSKHAAASQWVIKEAEYAKARQDTHQKLDFIPIMLDGPPPETPPTSLIDIHFNDRISYYIAAS